MSTITTTATAPGFSRTMGGTVSELAAGLQRVNARRAASRAVQASASGADDRHCEVSIPHLSSGFGFAAWLS